MNSSLKETPIKKMFKVKSRQKIEDIGRRFFNTQQKSRQRPEIHSIGGEFNLKKSQDGGNLLFMTIDREDGKIVSNKRIGPFV